MPETVAGLRIVYDDADIVVVDKPVGVAVHPSLGWSGPTVVGGLAGAGFRISTSGGAERQGAKKGDCDASVHFGCPVDIDRRRNRKVSETRETPA